MIKHPAYDLQEHRETTIFETEYGYEIIGADGKLYPITKEYATRYMLEYLTRPFNPLDYDLNVANEAA